MIKCFCRFVIKIIMFKRLCNSKMLLSFVTNIQILLKLVEECHLFLCGTFLKDLWFFFSLLLLLVFWTNLIVTICFLMQCSLLLLFLKIQGRSYKSKPKSIWLIVIRDCSWLSLFVFNIKREVWGVLKSLLSFYRRFCKKMFTTCCLWC
jgi:hypothetical protein